MIIIIVIRQQVLNIFICYWNPDKVYVSISLTVETPTLQQLCTDSLSRRF